MTILKSVIDKLMKSPIGTVAINMKPVKGPWGGSSVFVWQFANALKQHGFSVRFDLKQPVDVIMLIDPRDDLISKAFGMNEIRKYKQEHPEVKIIHRINECDKRKNTKFMDVLLQEANAVTDYTIFISEWLRDYFIGSWFDSKLAHSVIYNGADSYIFHPVGGVVHKEGQPFRIVTHHWADNPMKGFPVYEKLDRMITTGDITGVELWIIGRWPADIVWQSARLFPPASGQKLADLLRQCHLYITASLFEPCGMHHVEGTQCGLPLLAHADGGGIVEAAKKYGIVFKDDLKEAIETARDDYWQLREKVFANMPSGVTMACDYVRIVQRLLANRGQAAQEERCL